MISIISALIYSMDYWERNASSNLSLPNVFGENLPHLIFLEFIPLTHHQLPTSHVSHLRWFHCYDQILSYAWIMTRHGTANADVSRTIFNAKLYLWSISAYVENSSYHKVLKFPILHWLHCTTILISPLL